MRLWSIHPKHLDAKGIVALWRESLLAKNVLEGKTNGYKNHPQLNRFKNSENPVDAINYYLSVIYQESRERNYNFNKDKINREFKKSKITVTSGQLNYELEHLKKKLLVRDPVRLTQLNVLSKIDLHPIFKRVHGIIEEWEIV